MEKKLIIIAKTTGKAFYYGLILSAVIMQAGCASRAKEAMAQNEKAKASLQYGKNHNILISHYTGSLFY